MVDTAPKVFYYSVVMPCRGGSGIITDDTPDYSREACEKLVDLGVDYIHSYYWPGDDYYAFARIPHTDGGKAILAELIKEAKTVTLIDEHYLTHRGKTVGAEFAEQDEQNEKEKSKAHAA